MWRSKSHIESKYSISNTSIINYDCWAIHQGHHKTTRKAVSVFKFDKSSVKQATSNKLIQSQILSNLEKNISNLTKMKHPNILTVIEPLEIYKNLFIFVTEPVSNVLDSSYLNNSCADLIKLKGIYEIIQAMKFLLESTGNVHLGICPNSILINDKGDWKLSNFAHLLSINEQPPPVEYFINQIQIDKRFDHLLNLDLNFTAPEIILNSKIYDNSDFWSLGCLIYFVYSNGQFLIDCGDELRDYERSLNHLGASTLNYKLNQLEALSKELIPILNSMLNKNPIERLKFLDQLINTNEFQNNENLQFLIYLDNANIANHDDLIRNFSNYQNILPNFQTEILTQKILPILLNIIDLSLIDLKLVNYKLISLVLSMVLIIGSRLSNLSFSDMIFNKILTNKDIFLKNDEIQLILIKNLSLFRVKLSTTSHTSSSQNFNKFLINLIELTLIPTANLQIQFQSLNQIDIYLDLLDYSNIKNLLFVKICSIFNKTTSYQIKLTCLEVFIKFITSNDKSIDKFIIKESLFPLLASIKFKDAKILIKILTIYEIAIKLKFNSDTDEEYIVNDILPNMWKLSIEECLSLKDYETFASVINELTEDLQKKRLAILRAKAPPIEETTSVTPNAPNQRQTSFNSQNINNNNADDDFGGFNSNVSSTPVVNSFSTLSVKPTNMEPPRTNKHLTLQPSKQTSSFNSNTTHSFGQISSQTPSPSFQQSTFSHSKGQQASFNQASSFQPLQPQGQFQNSKPQQTFQAQSQQSQSQSQSQSMNTLQNLPPGFNSNLVMKKNITQSSYNDNNSYSSWDNGDSLI